MTERSASIESAPQAGLFAPLAQPQTYVNVVYLLLAFPLGIVYFVFLITGLSVGLSLTLIWIGIPILVLVMAAWWGMAAFERTLAIRMLGANIPPMTRRSEPVKGAWARLKAALGNPVTWKGLLYLFLKFPLGIFSFVLVVTLLSVSLGLIATPILVAIDPATVSIDGSSWVVDNPGETMLAAVIGIGIALLSAHAINWLAYASGWLAAMLLGDPAAAPDDGPPRGMPRRPTFRAGPQARPLAGAVLIGLGVLILLAEFVQQAARYVGPAALILVGALLLLPLARDLAGRKSQNGESLRETENAPEG